MKILETKKELCHCCMEIHEVKTVRVAEFNVFKEADVEYEAEYMYCDRANEFWADEEQIAGNYKRMISAYKEKER